MKAKQEVDSYRKLREGILIPKEEQEKAYKLFKEDLYALTWYLQYLQDHIIKYEPVDKETIIEMDNIIQRLSQLKLKPVEYQESLNDLIETAKDQIIINYGLMEQKEELFDEWKKKEIKKREKNHQSAGIP
jgi:hypothetical protein